MKININVILFVLFTGMYAAEAMKPKVMQDEPIENLPKPHIFIHEWHNATNHEIEVYLGHEKKTVLALLKPGQKIILDKEIYPEYSPVLATYHVIAAPRPNLEGRQFDVSAFYRLKPSTQTLEKMYPLKKLVIGGDSTTIFGVAPEFRNLSSLQISFGSHENINDAIVNLNITTQGNGFTQSKITATKSMTSKSLHQQSLENAANQIKAGRMTLEQAEKILPTELHEELKTLLKR